MMTYVVDQETEIPLGNGESIKVREEDQITLEEQGGQTIKVDWDQVYRLVDKYERAGYWKDKDNEASERYATGYWNSPHSRGKQRRLFKKSKQDIHDARREWVQDLVKRIAKRDRTLYGLYERTDNPFFFELFSVLTHTKLVRNRRDFMKLFTAYLAEEINIWIEL